MLRSILFSLVFLVGSAFAQVTPNLNFNIPVRGTQNWDALMNSNFTLLDNYLSGQNGFVLPGFNLNVITTPGTTGTWNITNASPISWTFCTTFGSTVCPYTFSALAPANSLQITSAGKLSLGVGVVNTAGKQHLAGGTSCATANTQFSTCTILYNWPVSFGDTNYNATCTPGALTGGLGAGTISSTSKSSTGINITIIKLDAAANVFSYVSIDCSGEHN